MQSPPSLPFFYRIQEDIYTKSEEIESGGEGEGISQNTQKRKVETQNGVQANQYQVQGTAGEWKSDAPIHVTWSACKSAASRSEFRVQRAAVTSGADIAVLLILGGCGDAWDVPRSERL